MLQNRPERAATLGGRGRTEGLGVDKPMVYLHYYQGSRTHLSLAKDAPEKRAVQPPELGPVIELAQVGGLHHRYERRAA